MAAGGICQSDGSLSELLRACFFLNVAYFWPQTGDFRAKADEPGYDVMSCKVTRSWRRGSFSPVLNLDHLSEERQAEVSLRTDVAEGEGERETD